MLNFRVRAGDKVLEGHLKHCSKNASYISKNAQNDLIIACGEVVTEKITNVIKHPEVKFFSIIADEAADSSGQEQMSLVVRFVDMNANIRDEFVGFVHCKYGLSGSDLSVALLEKLKNLDL